MRKKQQCISHVRERERESLCIIKQTASSVQEQSSQTKKITTTSSMFFNTKKKKRSFLDFKLMSPLNVLHLQIYNIFLFPHLTTHQQLDLEREYGRPYLLLSHLSTKQMKNHGLDIKKEKGGSCCNQTKALKSKRGLPLIFNFSLPII